MSGHGHRILVIEDEPSQLELLAYNLSKEGYDVIKAETAEEGLWVIQEQEVDLILIDWMLPELSGLEVCRQIKRNKSTMQIPVIMLTARGEEEDKVKGLDTGADDYVVKPYSIKELMARVRSGLRRSQSALSNDRLNYDPIEMDLVKHRVSVNGQNVHLGPLEFKLLRVLITAPGRVYSREQLLDRVWKDNLDVDTRTVDVHIGRLRKQLSKASEAKLIRTVRGFGYSLDSSA